MTAEFGRRLGLAAAPRTTRTACPKASRRRKAQFSRCSACCSRSLFPARPRDSRTTPPGHRGDERDRDRLPAHRPAPGGRAGRHAGSLPPLCRRAPGVVPERRGSRRPRRRASPKTKRFSARSGTSASVGLTAPRRPDAGGDAPAARAERDDRHHDHARDGDPKPSAARSSSDCSSCLALISALLVGYGSSVNRGRTWLHTVAFAAILALTIYVIVDLEFPRLGLIRVDAADQALVDLRASMK